MGDLLIQSGRTLGCSMSQPARAFAFPFTFPEGKVLRRSLEQPTAVELAMRRAPRCPVCTHGARMWMIELMLAWRCRWGHVVHDEDMETA